MSLSLMSLTSETEAERSVLGAMLLNPTAAEDVIEILGSDPSPFRVDVHQKIYSAIVSMDRQSMPIDMITLTDYFSRSGGIAEAGGAAYIAELTDAVPTSSNARYYAEIVKEEWCRQRIMQACANAGGALSRKEKESSEVIGELEGSLTLIAQGRDTVSMRHIADIHPEVLSDIQRRRRASTVVDGITTGIKRLDRMLMGLQPGTLNFLAARPSVGKSAMAANIGYSAAKAGHPVLFFSLEMKADSVVRRLTCIDQDVSFRTLCSDAPVSMAASNKKLTYSAISFGAMEFYIDDNSRLTMWQLRSRARRFIRKFPDKKCLIIVDYLTLMTVSHGGKQQRYELVGELARESKLLARELNAPILMLCQLGREADMEDDPFKCLRLMRESGNIEQDGDTIMVMLRKVSDAVSKWAQQEGVDPDSVVNFGLIKNRDGEVGQIPLMFDKPTQKISALEDKPCAPTQRLIEEHMASVEGEPWIEDTYQEDDEPF